MLTLRFPISLLEGKRLSMTRDSIPIRFRLKRKAA